jgi:uncharacterized membrane protein
MSYDELMRRVVQGFEVVGVTVLAIGSSVALVRYVLAIARREREGAFEAARRGVGRAILLGLEIMIIADIVRTITITTTFESVLTLAIIVLVRTFLSFSLEIELEGVVPWRRASSKIAAP